jgi:hypothetical protein
LTARQARVHMMESRPLYRAWHWGAFAHFRAVARLATAAGEPGGSASAVASQRSESSDGTSKLETRPEVPPCEKPYSKKIS